MRMNRIMASLRGVSLPLLFIAGTALAFAVSAYAGETRTQVLQSYAFPSPDGARWIANVRVWAYEPEEDSLLRAGMIKRLKEVGPEAEEDSPLFKERVRPFLVDNKRNRRPTLTIGGRSYALKPTRPDGHSFTQIVLPRAVGRAGETVPMTVRLSRKGKPVSGSVRLLADEGVLVVSDIDDTVKVSSVTDRRELLANTFFRPWCVVPGMAGLYAWWAEQGAAVHYLSGSPWQLGGELEKILAAEGFPAGVFHLRSFRLKDGPNTELLGDPTRHKRAVLERLRWEFPHREFVLVGDDGEKDPEIYGDFARRHRDRVAAIFIRRTGPEDAPRFAEAFRSLPPDCCRVFSDPSEIMP